MTRIQVRFVSACARSPSCPARAQIGWLRSIANQVDPCVAIDPTGEPDRVVGDEPADGVIGPVGGQDSRNATQAIVPVDARHPLAGSIEAPASEQLVGARTP